MNRPNRPEQPPLVTTAYLDDKLGELENNLLRELDARFDQFARDIDARFTRFARDIDARFTRSARDIDARFTQSARDLDVRLLKFEKWLAWKIVGTIVAVTAIFSAVVLIASGD